MATSSITGALMSQAQSSFLESQENTALRQLQSAQGAKEDDKIEKGAKEFEAMLLGTWLQQAEQSMATVPGAEDDEDGDSSGGQQMMSLGVQSLSTALSASGGIGIAAMISKALHSTADKAQQAAEAASAAGTEKAAQTH